MLGATKQEEVIALLYFLGDSQYNASELIEMANKKRSGRNAERISNSLLLLLRRLYFKPLHKRLEKQIKGREMRTKVREAKAKDGGVVIISLNYRYAQVRHIDKHGETVFESPNLVFSDAAKKLYNSLRLYK